MQTALWLIGTVQALGLTFLAISIRMAPEGDETPEGFDTPWRNLSPSVRDVSLVWAPVRA